MTTSIHNDSIVKLPASVLFVSDLNARKTEAADGIEDLAASILGEGLIENLVTVPELNVQNESTGRYGVVAGGRRCRALHLLILEGKIPPEYPVNCLIVEPERAIQLSLTENTKRQAMLGCLLNLSSILASAVGVGRGLGRGRIALGDFVSRADGRRASSFRIAMQRASNRSAV